MFRNSACLLDVTGDGRPEIIVSGNPGRTATLRFDRGRLYVLRGACYPAQVNLPVPVDANRDGRVDTLVLYSTEHGIVALRSGEEKTTAGAKERKRRKLPLIPVIPPAVRRRGRRVPASALLLLAIVVPVVAPASAVGVPLYCGGRVDPKTLQSLREEVHRQTVAAVHWPAEQERPTRRSSTLGTVARPGG